MISCSSVSFLVSFLCLLLSISIHWSPPISILPGRTSPTPFLGSRNHAVDSQDSKNNESLELEDVLKRLCSMVPDDDTRIDLLRPIHSTGAERLLQLGRRTRIYRTYFDIWQNLHVTRNEGIASIKEDVFEQIRQLNVSHTERTRLSQAYDEYRYFMSHYSHGLFPWTWPYFPDHLSLLVQNFRGRGIVFTASDVYISPLIVAIRNLRYLGCDLPIEVMYFGDQDLSPASRDLLAVYPGVFMRDMSLLLRNEDFGLGGWSLKPFALLFSSFREAILMDADAFMLRNPICLYEEPEYLTTGALYFHDRKLKPKPKKDMKAWLEQILHHPLSKQAKTNRLWIGQSSQMQESGLIIMDKWRHLVALLLACHLNGPEQDNQFLTDYVWGDKETYWLAQEMSSDTDYAFYSGSVAAMGRLQQHEEGTNKATICGKQLLHLDKTGRPFWFNGGLHAFTEEIRHETSFAFESDNYIIADKEANLDVSPWRQHELRSYWCLESKDYSFFSEHELQIMKSIRATARDIGMHE